MTFGDRLVDLLLEEKVEMIFSQGDLSLVEIQKCAQQKGIRLVGPRHEQVAAFMASGYYCMTGRMQVAMGAMGPGVSNMLSSAVCAAQENIPLLLIGSRRQSATNLAVRRNRWLYAPMLEMFRVPCKFVASIDTPGHLDDIVREAFRQAWAGTPGPVYLEFDYSIQDMEWDFPPPESPARYRAQPRAADAASMDKACDLIRSARKPVLMAGPAVVRNRLHAKFRKLADLVAAPVLTSLGGTGAVPESDDRYLFQFSQAGREAIEKSDLLIGIGTNFPEMDGYGRHGPFAAGAGADRKILVLETDPGMVGVNRCADHAVVGDLSLILGQLIAGLERARPTPAWAELSRLRAEYVAERERLAAAIPESEQIHPSRLMLETRKAVPDDAVIVLDGGLTILHKMAFFEQRSSEFLYTSTFSHLGSGLGYAIGAQLAAGSRRVCLLTGDGALGFHLAEFETLVRHQLPVVVIVNDDRALGAEMSSHMQHVGHAIEATFSPVRYDQIARAMGGHGEYVQEAQEIVPAVQRAFSAGKPALVQVVTDQKASYMDAPPYVDALAGWLGNDALSPSGLF